MGRFLWVTRLLCSLLPLKIVKGKFSGTFRGCERDCDEHSNIHLLYFNNNGVFNGAHGSPTKLCIFCLFSFSASSLVARFGQIIRFYTKES